MALSTLYPGPNAAHRNRAVTVREWSDYSTHLPQPTASQAIRRLKSTGWNVGFPAPPSSFDKNNVLATLQGLDRHWDRPSDDTAGAIRGLLDSKHVLVRYQAAVALGRFADPGAIDPLARRLGDPSKIVQRAAAWALR